MASTRKLQYGYYIQTQITYKHIYSHKDDPLKIMKIHKTMTIEKATIQAKSPSPEALLNIAHEKAAEKEHQTLKGVPRTKPILTKEVQITLDIGETCIFRDMKKSVG